MRNTRLIGHNTKSNGDVKKIVFDFISFDELVNEKHANAFFLNSILRDARRKGEKANYVQYSDLGMLGIFARVAKRTSVSSDLSRKNVSGIVFTALFFVFSHFFSLVDLTLRSKLLRILRDEGEIESVVVSYPYLVETFKKLTAKLNKKVKITLLEHNIESKYSEYNMGGIAKTSAGRFLLLIISKIENEAIKEADDVLTGSLNDMNWVRRKFPGKEVSLIPYVRRDVEFKISLPTRMMTHSLKQFDITSEKINIFFIGSNYTLNVRSVEHLISLSRSLEDLESEIAFVIIGSVSKQFENYKDIPGNVYFLGYIDDLENVSCYADLFFLESLMNTGFESKAYSYSYFDRPIVVLGGDLEDFKRFSHSHFVHFNRLEDFEKMLRSIVNSRLKVTCSTVYKLSSTNSGVHQFDDK